jgi:hypothetical protein
MKKNYRYSIDVLMPDFILKNRPINILEFNTVTNKINAAYKQTEPQNFEFASPEKMKEITSERAVKVEVVVRAENFEEAIFRAEKVVEEKFAIISFLSMYPVKPLNKGGISEELTENVDHITLLTTESENTQVFNAQLIDNIKLLFNQPDEKITQSLRWFRKGLLDSNPFDAFISGWIALEMISSKLKPSGMKFLKCPRCLEEIEVCPHCEKSTETRPMEKDGIIHHITNNLKINDDKFYSRLNNMRNDIFHGRSKKIKMTNLKEELSNLRYCLITAYWFLVYGSLPDFTTEIFKRFDLFFLQQLELTLELELSADAVREIRENNKVNFVELKNN